MGETGTSDSEKAGFVELELANWSEKKDTSEMGLDIKFTT